MASRAGAVPRRVEGGVGVERFRVRGGGETRVELRGGDDGNVRGVHRDRVGLLRGGRRAVGETLRNLKVRALVGKRDASSLRSGRGRGVGGRARRGSARTRLRARRDAERRRRTRHRTPSRRAVWRARGERRFKPMGAQLQESSLMRSETRCALFCRRPYGSRVAASRTGRSPESTPRRARIHRP